jgi:hypothetical protein
MAWTETRVVIGAATRVRVVKPSQPKAWKRCAQS